MQQAGADNVHNSTSPGAGEVIMKRSTDLVWTLNPGDTGGLLDRS